MDSLSPDERAAIRELLSTVHFEDRLPPGVLTSIWEHVILGQETGSFVRSMLENDFVAAASKADDKNVKHLQPLARHIHSRVPSGAWGSKEAVSEWEGLISFGTGIASDFLADVAGLDQGTDFVELVLDRAGDRRALDKAIGAIFAGDAQHIMKV